VGWFLLVALQRFAGLVEGRGETDRATAMRKRAEQLRQALEAHGWDGAWYRRAYFDDGTPLGSAQNDECRIDSLTQTWAVISGVADPTRTRQAMTAVDERLVLRSERLIVLFTPPFDNGPLRPGYIRGYLPGVRENGGQYTHAATWVLLATALQKRGAHALELLELLNPIHRTATAEGVQKYRVEPYVVAGDVYLGTAHADSGGWSWYTGAAAWLYHVTLEHVLGLQRSGAQLRFAPCLAPRWREFSIRYRYRETTYRIEVKNPDGLESGTVRAWLDDREQPDATIALENDLREHAVRVELSR
jgi:cyclic beta-1,2-glucan synthetase